MSTPIIEQRPVNQTIYETIHTICMTAVELTPETQAIFEKRDALIEEIKGKVPVKTSGQLADVTMEMACHFGDEMFKLGLALGRDPEKIFSLPNVGL